MVLKYFILNTINYINLNFFNLFYKYLDCEETQTNNTCFNMIKLSTTCESTQFFISTLVNKLKKKQ
jgi:hypothetical protein